MDTTTAAGPRSLACTHRGPAIIAHAANSVEGIRAAIAAGADLLEADFWSRGPALEARHDRRAGWLPVLYERWRLGLAPRRPLEADSLFEAIGDARSVFFDFKGGTHATVQQLAAALHGHAGRRHAASSQNWETVRAVADAGLPVDLFYSVDVPAKLDLLRSVRRRDQRMAGISCNHRLLDRDTIRQIHDLGMAVVAYTVDDPGRATELSLFGVDGITTHRVRELRALFDAP
jgi:glycerophosphoryl diester phosphodiesterase